MSLWEMGFTLKRKIQKRPWFRFMSSKSRCKRAATSKFKSAWICSISCLHVFVLCICIFAGVWVHLCEGVHACVHRHVEMTGKRLCLPRALGFPRVHQTCPAFTQVLRSGTLDLSLEQQALFCTELFISPVFQNTQRCRSIASYKDYSLHKNAFSM